MFCIVHPNIFLPWAYLALNFWVRHCVREMQQLDGLGYGGGRGRGCDIGGGGTGRDISTGVVDT